MRLILLALFFSFTGCHSQKEKFSYESSIASEAFSAHMNYLDATLYNYSSMTDTGYTFYKLSQSLDEFTDHLKQKLRQGKEVDEIDKVQLFKEYDGRFLNRFRIDGKAYESIKQLPIKSVADIDILKSYLKNNLVCILLNNKIYPFNGWSLMADPSNKSIIYGEEYTVQLANTAYNTFYPHEWYVKDLYDGKLIDTLSPNEFGVVNFKTKKYRRGTNQFQFISRFVTPGNEDQLSITVELEVK